MLPFTELKSAAWLGWLGLNPTLEALSAQFVIIVFALASYLVMRRNARIDREAKAASAMRTAKP
jgi:high-affinity iron transporter